MLDAIVPATAADFDAVWELYADVCAHQAVDPYGPMWTLGVYPAREDIAEHIEAHELYVGLLDGRIVAAMVLVLHDDPEYAGIPWPTPASADEAAVIHLLCVHPQARGHQAGLSLARECIHLARSAGMRAIHLDVVPGNLAASRIYLAAGFSYVCDRDVYYEDIGAMTFELYEYAC